MARAPKQPPQEVRMDEADPAVEQLPATLGMDEAEFLQDAEENKIFERDETIVPFLRVLQPLSPTVQEDGPNQVQGAKAGMFYNNATETTYPGKDGILLIPITHQKSYVEWTPIAKGGGFVRDWGESLDWQKECTPEQAKAYRPETKVGTQITYSIHFYALVVDAAEGTFDPVIMPFTGTQMKRARAWASMMMNAKVKTSRGPKTAPYHYFLYQAVTFPERNEKGSWYGVKISHLLNGNGERVRTLDITNGMALYEAAKAFKQSLQEGTIRAATPDRPFENGAGGENEGDEVPF